MNPETKRTGYVDTDNAKVVKEKQEEIKFE